MMHLLIMEGVRFASARRMTSRRREAPGKSAGMAFREVLRLRWAGAACFRSRALACRRDRAAVYSLT